MNFQNAADVIGDAISGLGVNVPGGTSLYGMASLISLYLIKKAVKSTVSMRCTTGAWAPSGVIPLVKESISGTAFSVQGSIIYVNHATQITITLKANTISQSSNSAGSIMIQKNGVQMASASVPAGSNNWGFKTATYKGNANAGDIFRATWNGGEKTCIQDVTFSATGNN